MKNHNIELILIENAKDVDTVKSGRSGGCVAFPVGTVLNKNCLDGDDCDTIPFVPNDCFSGKDQALMHIAKEFFDTDLSGFFMKKSMDDAVSMAKEALDRINNSKKPAKKAVNPRAKAVSTKKPVKAPIKPRAKRKPAKK